MKLFENFGFNSKKKVVLLGYDLGGAIALSCGFHSKLMKAVSAIITLHPTWTDSIEKLAMINIPTLLFWFPLEDFHLISAGQKMSKAIKTSKLYRFNINPIEYNNVGCYYGQYAE
jgi:predicted esterase